MPLSHAFLRAEFSLCHTARDINIGNYRRLTTLSLTNELILQKRHNFKVLVVADVMTMRTLPTLMPEDFCGHHP